MKFYPRFYQLITGTKVISTSTKEFSIRRALKIAQAIDKRARVIVYDRVGTIADSSKSIEFKNSKVERDGIMPMTHAQLDEHDAEIKALFRSWIERMEGDKPDWMTTEEYELLHKCVREALASLRKKESTDAT